MKADFGDVLIRKDNRNMRNFPQSNQLANIFPDAQMQHLCF